MALEFFSKIGLLPSAFLSSTPFTSSGKAWKSRGINYACGKATRCACDPEDVVVVVPRFLDEKYQRMPTA